MGNCSVDLPTIVLTSFWDANYLLGQRSITYISEDELCVAVLDDAEVHSIALASPPVRLMKHITEEFHRLDIFTPTYPLLQEYKATKDWDAYIPVYNSLLLERRGRIMDWITSLDKGKVYLLCCWEATDNKDVHCHRELIYKALLTSKSTKDMVKVIYRHGKKTLDTVQGELDQAAREVSSMNGKEVIGMVNYTLMPENVSEFKVKTD